MSDNEKDNNAFRYATEQQKQFWELMNKTGDASNIAARIGTIEWRLDELERHNSVVHVILDMIYNIVNKIASPKNINKNPAVDAKQRRQENRRAEIVRKHEMNKNNNDDKNIEQAIEEMRKKGGKNAAMLPPKEKKKEVPEPDTCKILSD